MARLKIATFNINGIRARHGALLQWLEREAPDIACLQELKAPDEAFPLADIERLGYGALWHGQKSWNGVAILARGAQPEERQRGLPDDPDGTQSRYLEADVHGLRVACLYLPNGNPWPGPKFDYKLAWFAELQRRARKLLKDGLPTVMCGDFNVVPTDELDIYNARSWKTDALLQPESREAWFELLAQGWTDAIRAIHGDARIYTFWDYFRKHWERDAGLRIDHLLLSPALAPMLHDAGVDRWARGQPSASDHAPTWVELDTAGGGKTRRRTAVRKAASSQARGGEAAEAPRASTARKAGAAGRSKAKGASTAANPQRTANRVPERTAAVEKRGARKTPASKTAASKRVSKTVVSKETAAKKATKKATGKRVASKPAAAKKRPTGNATAGKAAAKTRPGRQSIVAKASRT